VFEPAGRSQKLTVEDAIEIATSPGVSGADLWQDRLRKGLEQRQ